MAYGLSEPKTDVAVRLTGCHDVFQIMRRVEKSLKYAGYEELAGNYVMEATSGDFDHLMITTLEFVHVKNDQPNREYSRTGTPVRPVKRITVRP